MPAPSKSFAHTLSAQQREYLSLLLHEATAPLHAKIQDLEIALQDERRCRQSAFAVFRDELESLRSYHEADIKYALTKPKLIALMRHLEKQGDL